MSVCMCFRHCVGRTTVGHWRIPAADSACRYSGNQVIAGQADCWSCPDANVAAFPGLC